MVNTAASQHQGPRFDSRLGSLCGHVLPVSAWVSSGCSSFLPQSKDVQVSLIDHAKSALVSVDYQGKYVGLWEWGLGGIVVDADLMG